MNISLTNLPKITFRATSNVSNQNMQTAPHNMQSQPVKDTFEKSDLVTNNCSVISEMMLLDYMYLFMRECCNTKEVKTGGVYKDGK